MESGIFLLANLVIYPYEHDIINGAWCSINSRSIDFFKSFKTTADDLPSSLQAGKDIPIVECRRSELRPFC